MKRPEIMHGTTYVITVPGEEYEVSVVINDVVDDDGVKHPYELMVISDHIDHHQWVVALTKLVSASMRLGVDMAMICDELDMVYDPKGGYWKRGGKYIPSLVADISQVLRKHVQSY